MGSSVLRSRALMIQMSLISVLLTSESKQLVTLVKYNENKSSRPADHLTTSCAMIYAST